MTPGTEHYVKRNWLDVSTLNTFVRCPRKYFYQIGCSQRQPGLSVPMDYGSALHKALPELLIEPVKSKAIIKATAAFSTVWTLAHETSGDDKRNLNRAMASFDRFFDVHAGRNGLYTLEKPPERPGVLSTKDHVNDYEIPFGLDIGLSVPLVGRVDALVRHRDTQELYGLEWKTTSQGGSWFLDGFDLSPQLVAYYMALRMYGVEVKGMFLEAIVSSKVNASVLLKPIYIQPFHVDAFVQWARFWGGMLLEMERTMEFPQWFTGCGPYPQFGSPGFICDYQPLCQVEDWTTLKSLYKTEVWNPFEVKKEKGISLPVIPAGGLT